MLSSRRSNGKAQKDKEVNLRPQSFINADERLKLIEEPRAFCSYGQANRRVQSIHKDNYD
jgi:hypothetical protein